MVYRPPKHKPAVGARPAQPSSDPLGNPPGHAADPEANLPGDDRNLVAVDESYSGGDLEDRMWLFWRRQGTNVLRLVTVAFVVLIIWQGWNLYQGHVLSSLQTEYRAATGASGLAAFAEAHPDATLGRLAILEAADAYYKAGKFKDAADAYGKAAATWGIDEKGQRARLGWGLALAQDGDLAGAEQHLQSLYEDAAALVNFRAEAAFYNAVLFAQKGDTASAATWIDHVNGFNSDRAAALWVSQAATLTDAIPAAKEVKVAPTGITALPTSMDNKSAPASATPPPVAIRAAATSAAATTSAPAAPKATIAATPPPPVPVTKAPATTGFDLSKLNGAATGGTSSR